MSSTIHHKDGNPNNMRLDNLEVERAHREWSTEEQRWIYPEDEAYARERQLVEQVTRSARLYQRGLITAQEFTNVTLEDLHRMNTQAGEDL